MTDPWQDFDAQADPGPPFGARYPARMPDGSLLHLPIRPLGVAGLIATQASFPVVHALARWMAGAAAPLQPEMVLGLPTRCRRAPGRPIGPRISPWSVSARRRVSGKAPGDGGPTPPDRP